MRAAPILGSDRNAQIRSLAAEMFFDRGYEAVTIREIAAALGITPASIYYHFPDKEEILFQIVESVLAQITTGARTLLARERSAPTQLCALVVNHVTLHAQRPKETTLGDTELRSLTGQRRQRYVKARDIYQALVLDTLERGAREGSFELTDAKLTTYALIAQGSNVGAWFHEPGRLSLETVARIHSQVALRMAGAAAVADREIIRLVDETRQLHAEFGRPA